MDTLTDTDKAAIKNWVAAQLNFVEAGMERYGSLEAFLAVLDWYETAKAGE